MSGDPPAAPLRILILGGASGIAIATARLYAAEGAALLLAGRRPSRLESVAQDLRVRGAGAVVTFPIDLAAEPDPARRLAEMAAALGGVDHILVAYGVLGDQGEGERDAAAAAQSLAVNFTSAAGWTLAAANLIEAQGRGSLVVLGSVAGDRGRRANYIYGAAKAGIAALVEGVAHRSAAPTRRRFARRHRQTGAHADADDQRHAPRRTSVGRAGRGCEPCASCGGARRTRSICAAPVALDHAGHPQPAVARLQ